ncbi:MAG: NAD-dependent epimerase/dehydratase family protein [Daejeonella sp.]
MIIVTGATGFLGSELSRQLTSQGEKIICLKRSNSIIPKLLNDNSLIEWRNADITDYFSLKDALAGATKIYHCAAFISFNPADKKKMLKINVEGTAHVVDICLENPQVKLLHVSSVSAVGEAKNGQQANETNIWEFNNSKSAYSISKYESEMEVFKGIAEGLDAVIVNPSVIIGKNAGTEGSGKLFETVNKGLKYYPTGSFGLVDVADVAETMIRLMDSDISGERYLINAENYTYKQFFSEVAQAFHKNPPSTELKPWMLKSALFFSKLTKLFGSKETSLTSETVRSAFKKQHYSNSKVKDELNFNFKPISKSILEICESWKEN